MDLYQNEYNIIAKDSVDKSILKSLSKKILEKEQYIKELNDNSKVLFRYVNKDSVTQYHHYYNLIEFDFEEINILVSKIKEMIFNLYGWDSFYLKMWANIYRNGDYIGWHKHMENRDNKKYFESLTGHFFIYSSKPTSTTFLFKKEKKYPLDSSYREIDIPNIPGEITLFSSYVEHCFKQWDGDLRISIAFDINNQSDGDSNLLKKWKFIKV